MLLAFDIVFWVVMAVSLVASGLNINTTVQAKSTWGTIAQIVLIPVGWGFSYLSWVGFHYLLGAYR